MNSIRSFIRHIILESDNQTKVQGGIAGSLIDAEETPPDDSISAQIILKADTALSSMRADIIADVNGVLEQEIQVGRWVSNDDEIQRARGTEFLLRKDIADIRGQKFEYPYRTALYSIGHFNGELSVADDLDKISKEASAAADEVRKNIDAQPLKQGRSIDADENVPMSTPQNERRNRKQLGLLLEVEAVGLGLAFYSGWKLIMGHKAAEAAGEGAAAATKAGGRAASKAAAHDGSVLIAKLVRNSSIKLLSEPRSFRSLINELIAGGPGSRALLSTEAMVDASPAAWKPAARSFTETLNQWWSTVDVEILRTKKTAVIDVLTTINKKSAGTSFEALNYDRSLEMVRVILKYIISQPGESHGGRVTADVIMNSFATLEKIFPDHPDPVIMQLSKDIPLLMTAWNESSQSATRGLPRDIAALPNGDLKTLLTSTTDVGSLVDAMKKIASFGESCAEMLPSQLPVSTWTRIGVRTAVTVGTAVGAVGAVVVAIVAAGLITKGLMSAYEVVFLGFDYIPANVTDNQLKSIFTDVKIRASASAHMQSAIDHPPTLWDVIRTETIETGIADKMLLELLKKPAGYEIEEAATDAENCRQAYADALAVINQDTIQ